MKSISLRSGFFLMILFFVFSVRNGQAQDTIIKNNGDIIRAKITEIGTEEVKFRVFGDADGPIIILKKSDIKTAKVAGQTIIDVKSESASESEDIIIKKTGDALKVKVLDIGVDEVKFKLYNDPYGPTISIPKSDIRTMKVGGQTVIDVKGGTAEDIINKKDGTVLKTKISEIGSDEVKFKLYNNPDGPTMSLKKSEIQNIKIDGQVVYEYKIDPMSTSNQAILDRNSSLKFYFFSPLNRHIAFGYEWMIRPGFNWEIGAGVIGPGTSLSIRDKTPKGGFIRFGPKFLLGSSSDIEIEGAKYAHPLKGRYFKVEMILNTTKVTYFDSYFYTNNSSTIITHRNNFQSMSLDLGYGRQFIFGNAITVGYYLGIGYSFENKTTTVVDSTAYYNSYQSYFDGQRYSHSFLGENFPLATTVRFTVGYIFPTPQWLKGKKSRSLPPTRHSMEKK